MSRIWTRIWTAAMPPALIATLVAANFALVSPAQASVGDNQFVDLQRISTPSDVSPNVSGLRLDGIELAQFRAHRQQRFGQFPRRHRFNRGGRFNRFGRHNRFNRFNRFGGGHRFSRCAPLVRYVVGRHGRFQLITVPCRGGRRY